MRITTKGIMPDKTKIQMEDWSQDIPSIHTINDVVAVYPIAKQPATVLEFEGVNGFRRFEYPQQYRRFRLALQFPCETDAKTAYDRLLNGNAELLDYVEYMQEKKLANCLKC
jgi:hypothetical protein